MKAFKYLIWFFACALTIAGCKKDNYSLSERPDKSQIKFDVIQDLETDPGGNTVILVNKTPETIAIWDYGTGKSNRDRDTIHFAFAGDYVIKFAAETGGGVVEMDPVTVKVTADNLNYVNDPLWNFLTGGVGQEKTWILDYGDHGIFDGPLSYYEPLTNWQQMQDGTAKLGWAPAWKDNQWIIPEADKASTMTFSLKGGPFMKTHKVTEGVDESGTYFLDADGKTLTTSGATILRSQSFIANATNWNNNLVILSLTENQLQVGVRRTNSEGDYLYVWNFISKEYADNYVPPETGPKLPDAGFDPKFEPGGLLTMITGASGYQTWAIDGAGNAIDWIGKGNGWTKSSNDSRDWGWNASWDAVAGNSWIRFEKNGMKYFRNQEGTVTTGTFTINEATNEVMLNGNLLIQNTGNWMSPASNTFKVIKAFPEESDTKGIWFATSYDAAKDEWFAFHYIKQ